MTVELASDCVGISVYQGEEAFVPLINEARRRNMPDQMNQLPFRLRVPELILQPL